MPLFSYRKEISVVMKARAAATKDFTRVFRRFAVQREKKIWRVPVVAALLPMLE
jgi:hypothetical protein